MGNELQNEGSGSKIPWLPFAKIVNANRKGYPSEARTAVVEHTFAEIC
jgi:hypothetical protein